MQVTDQQGYLTLKAIAKAGEFNAWTYQTIKPFLKGDILEIGSGIGNISNYVVAEHPSVTLSDFDEGYCGYLKQTYGNHPHVKEVLRIDLQHSDFCGHYAHLQESFDSIYLLNVIEHLADDAKAVFNCRYLLKPGGNLIALAPAYHFLYSNIDKELGHFRRYTSSSLAGLMKSEQLIVLQNRYFNALGMMGWLFAGVIFRSKSISGSEMKAFNRLVPLAKMTDRLFLHAFGLSVITIATKPVSP